MNPDAKLRLITAIVFFQWAIGFTIGFEQCHNHNLSPAWILAMFPCAFAIVALWPKSK